MLVEKTTCDNKFVNFLMIVTKFVMCVDIVDIKKSHDFGCYGKYFCVKVIIIYLPNCGILYNGLAQCQYNS